MRPYRFAYQGDPLGHLFGNSPHRTTRAILEASRDSRYAEKQFVEAVFAVLTKAKNRILDKRDRYYARTQIEKLVQAGYLQRSGSGVTRYFLITKKGRHRLATLRLHSFSFQSKPWDGLWRMLTFDIAEMQRSDRTLLREQLKKLGFMRLQQSVWVTPHECEEFVSLLKAEFRFGRQVVYVVAQTIEDDGPLRKYFNL